MHCSRERGGIALTLSALAAALLAACGGGGSDTAAPTESAAAAKMPAEFTVPARSAPDASQRGSVRADAPEEASRLPESRLYIVQMIESPAVDYRGSIAGYATTKPVRGTKFDSTNPAVQKYVGYLKARHDAVLAKVGAANKKAYSYAYTFNGFSAELTDAQVEQLKATQGVVSVMKDSARKLTTTTTRNFLGLTGPGGFYATTQAKGENIVIGVVDTGIWPEHPSFAGEEGNASSNGTGAVRGYPRVRGWNGMCEAGENFPATMCNGKLIGARYYTAGIGGNQVVQKFLPWEFLSPRDFNGHGTHTASTAGGNENVPTTGLASVFAPSAASRRARASPPTRPAGTSTATARASRATASRRSTRRWPTAWTSSTSRSAAAPATSWTPSRWPCCSRPTPACSSRHRRATLDRPHPPWRIRARG
jgi:subtilisin family serine protease